jgi:diguanylate cyclase (GGDEF)-like protein
MQFRIPDDSPALQQAIRVSQAVNRVRQLPTVFVANPLLAIFLSVVFWDRVDRTLLVLFVAAMIILWMPAILSWRRLRHRPRPEDVSRGNERRAMLFSVIAGSLWGAAAWTLYPVAWADERALLMVLVSGLTGGSVAFFSSSPVASLLFFIPLNLPLFVQSVRLTDPQNPILPAALGVFLLVAILFTKTSWRQFVENVRVLVERDRALAQAGESQAQMERAFSRMQDLAMVDELTGLKNRRAFFDDAEPMIAGSRRREQPIAVAVLDLDHFKDVNDTHGHAVGDVVLKAAATRIVDNFREEQITGRFGGEEFVVLLPYTSPAQALVALERVRKALSATPIEVAGGPAVTVTLSGGIAPLLENMEIETAIDHADKAMYRAKALGRDRVEVFLET